MTYELRQELIRQRDYLRRACELAENLDRNMTGDPFAGDMAHLRGYLQGGLEMLEARIPTKGLTELSFAGGRSS